MLWRVRLELPNQPGVLARAAGACGEAGVNIVGLNIFPSAVNVTDEFIVQTPETWGPAELGALLAPIGTPGSEVVVQECTPAALADQPTRYVQAARTILDSPNAFPEVVAELFDAESDPASDSAVVQDVMDLTVGDVDITIHRLAPFTEVELARGRALADLVTDVLERAKENASGIESTKHVHDDKTPNYVTVDDTVTAFLDGIAVGYAIVRPRAGDAEVHTRPITLRVEPGWQRRGIGKRLLLDAARLASSMGADEIVMTTRSDNQAMMPLVLSAGLRGRIRMATDILSVRVPVKDLA